MRMGTGSRIAIVVVNSRGDPATIGAAISRHAESRPHSIAVVAAGFSPLIYRDPQRRSNRESSCCRAWRNSTSHAGSSSSIASERRDGQRPASSPQGGVEMTGEIFVDETDRLQSSILQIFRRLLESSDLSIDDDFFDSGGDSLLATELMLELRKLTGKALPDSLLFESSTIRALGRRLSEKEAPQAKAVVRVGSVSDGAAPLLFFHGDWTRGGFYVEHLARKLGPETSLIAVAPHGAGGERIPDSIEEMAADRLPAILAEQPTGPYRLAGHCVGGIVALETARLLTSQNHEVETVVMIDSPWIVGGKPLRTQRVHGDGDAGARDPASAPDDTPIRPLTPDVDWGFETYEGRLAGYSPSPLPVSLLVVASEYDGRDWVRLGQNAKLLEIPGDHFDLVTVRINELAGELRSWLNRDRSLGGSGRYPRAGAEKDEASPTGSGDRETNRTLAREHEEKVNPSRASEKKIATTESGRLKYDFLSRGLRHFFGQARR
jgi:acyl carrier protein